jgi:serine protease Do
VVNIATTQTVKAPSVEEWFGPFFGPPGEGSPFEEFFRRFGPPVPKTFKRRSLGSGFVLEPNGTIVTNHHVIDQAEEIVVRLASRSKDYKARVIGSDPKTDLALLRIEPDHELPVLRLGDSDRIRVGDWVVAIGNPFGLEKTVTAGIVSATGRTIGQGPYDDFIQTDASINPGNSGGPLLNLQGEVIGINSAIFSRTGGNLGIGFAIPSNLARSVLQQLEERGKVVRGWLGIVIQEVTEDLAKSFGLEEPVGALVSDVQKGGPADKGGIERGDVILSYRGKRVESSRDLPRMVADTPPGTRVEIEVRRGDRTRTLQVEVGEMPAETAEAEAGAGERRREAPLGLALAPVTPDVARRLEIPEGKGVLVQAVRSGSPAEEAGIRAGDVILEVNREPVDSVGAFREAVKKSAKDTVLLLVRRGDSTIFIALRRPG